MPDTTAQHSTATAAALAWFEAWEAAEYPGPHLPMTPAEEQAANYLLLGHLAQCVGPVAAAPGDTAADIAAKLIQRFADSVDDPDVPDDSVSVSITDDAKRHAHPELIERLDRMETVRAMQRQTHYLPANHSWDHNALFFRGFGGLRNTPTAELRRELDELRKLTEGRPRRRHPGLCRRRAPELAA